MNDTAYSIKKQIYLIGKRAYTRCGGAANSQVVLCVVNGFEPLRLILKIYIYICTHTTMDEKHSRRVRDEVVRRATRLNVIDL